MRAELLTALTTGLNTTGIAVSNELPWNTGNEPLYLKNMKRVYLGPEQRVDEDLIPILNGNNVKRRQLTVRGYLAVDAKNPPTQTDSAINLILTAKGSTGVVNFDEESDYTVEIDEDVIVYTFEFRIRVATT